MHTQHVAGCLQLLKCKVIQYPSIRGTGWAGVELQKITCLCMWLHQNKNNIGTLMHYETVASSTQRCSILSLMTIPFVLCLQRRLRRKKPDGSYGLATVFSCSPMQETAKATLPVKLD